MCIVQAFIEVIRKYHPKWWTTKMAWYWSAKI